MKKIAYMAPEMEVMKLVIESPILNISDGGGDPKINPEWNDGDVDPFPDDDDLPS